MSENGQPVKTEYTEWLTEELVRQSRMLHRLKELEDRLEAAGILVSDFADLIWMEIEKNIEERIEKLAREAVKDALMGVTLVSFVEGLEKR